MSDVGDSFKSASLMVESASAISLATLASAGYNNLANETDKIQQKFITIQPSTFSWSNFISHGDCLSTLIQ